MTLEMRSGNISGVIMKKKQKNNAGMFLAVQIQIGSAQGCVDILGNTGEPRAETHDLATWEAGEERCGRRRGG